ncbi:MAG: CocE/NonD family hydrolase [Planctomycetes bacterium]|nr:CocE/NonD family hydrolase [Planctomycetota bacterium]
MHLLRASCLSLVIAANAFASAQSDGETWLRERYAKREVHIPMRDGAKLFAAIYEPRDRSRTYPILLRRTPYSVRPYGEEHFPSVLGPSRAMEADGYVFVLADVRGRYLSEGEFENMRPHGAASSGPHAVDESTDTYDTIAWLLDHVDSDSGKVGMWGISYPGFYAAAGMIDAHPALAAVSPQAPIADWWFDDFHHHGAFFLADAFNFMSSFGRARPVPTTESAPGFDHGTPDGWRFFLDIGPLSNVRQRWFGGDVAFWDAFVEHPNYDEFWRARNLLPHLERVAPAVLTVGGWFDAEDLYGPLSVYRAVERQNPSVFNVLVMGPWRHGGWARDDGSRLGEISFGAPTAEFYRNEIERKFFARFLRGEDGALPAEATMFETGTNRWRTFDAWPPKTESRAIYLREAGSLSFEPPPASVELAHDGYLSDPAKPVPYHERIQVRTPPEYMTDDQRFASRRPDVLHYESEPLVAPLTCAGPSTVELWITTTGSDADFVVKLIDVFPRDTPNSAHTTPGRALAGYQMLVRAEVFRARFRESYAEPKALAPGERTRITFPLQDVLHTFQPGHRFAIQIQSTWFPLVDRNPQVFVANPFTAGPDDLRPAWITVERSATHASALTVGVLPPEASR